MRFRILNKRLIILCADHMPNLSVFMVNHFIKPITLSMIEVVIIRRIMNGQYLCRLIKFSQYPPFLVFVEFPVFIKMPYPRTGLLNIHILEYLVYFRTRKINVERIARQLTNLHNYPNSAGFRSFCAVGRKQSVVQIIRLGSVPEFHQVIFKVVYPLLRRNSVANKFLDVFGLFRQ